MDINHKRSTTMIYYTHYRSPMGDLLLVSDGTALTGLTFGKPEPGWEQLENLAIFDSVSRWLDSYFAGTPGPVDFPLSPSGTEFQRRVWDILLTIPYGETTTYSAIAKQLGAAMSPQAVGQAVGNNPLAILIPCHRVVGAKGNLTGYAWGIEKKKWLLCHEEETK